MIFLVSGCRIMLRVNPAVETFNRKYLESVWKLTWKCYNKCFHHFLGIKIYNNELVVKLVKLYGITNNYE